MQMSYKIFTPMGTGCCLPKTMFWTKICEGLGQGSIWKKCGTLRIFATVESSNFKFGTQLGFGTSLPKTTFWTKICEGLGQGSIWKKCGTLRIFATVEASNFKFGIQLGFGTSLPKNNVLDQNWRGSGPGEHSEKNWDPYVFLQPLKLETSNLVHKLGLGLAYQKPTFRTKISGGLG